jgi:hypothetical protein
MNTEQAGNIGMKILSVMWGGIRWGWGWALENPIIAIVALGGILLIYLFLDHGFDIAEGVFRDKMLKILFAILFVVIVVLILSGLDSGKIPMPW